MAVATIPASRSPSVIQMRIDTETTAISMW